MFKKEDLGDHNGSGASVRIQLPIGQGVSEDIAGLHPRDMNCLVSCCSEHTLN